MGLPHNGCKAVVGNGSHFWFLVTSRGQVQVFHLKALETGGKSDGAMGTRELYGARRTTGLLRAAWMVTRLRRLSGTKLPANLEASGFVKLRS